MSQNNTDNTVYLVFDVLPKKQDGGLVQTYRNFVNEFSNEVRIVVVSVFSPGKNDIEEFEALERLCLSSVSIDNRFYRLFSYLAHGELRRFAKALFSAFYYFLYIPFGRIKTRKLMRGAKVIASAPAAGMFISKHVRYILEIHTSFNYFWQGSVLGRLQPKLMTKPVLTLFRTKADQKKGEKLFRSGYIYNACSAPDCISVDRAPDVKPRSRALYVGRLVDSKNPEMLIECAERVRRQLPGFTLDIYGVGEKSQDIERLITQKNLASTVRLMGYVDDKSVYSKYDVLWVTSRYEGFGLVIIEAMACGTPCITTNWGDAVSEIVEDGASGYIASSAKEFSDKTVSLLNDNERWLSFSSRSRAKYRESFTPQCNKKAWVEILDREFPNVG